MCGICGLAASDPLRVPLEVSRLQRMTDVIEHRGPDDQGHHLEPGIALGARRLSIIDVAGGHQPVANEDGSVHAILNGEIYNFRELRDELLASGHRLTGGGDTEVLVHLYEAHGPGFVSRLRGMFALAVWDRRARRLTLARDRMGVKPLYLALGAHGLAFASEVKALLAGGLVEPTLDPMAAELFLAHGFVPGRRTLFAGVTKLPPATVLVWEDGALDGERVYWTPWDGPAEPGGRSFAEDQERLLDLLRTATRARMVSDVPLGVMLSGGLDSSLVTALMAEASHQPVKTFSIGFAEDATANELPDARRVAERLGTEHHELTTSAVEHPELLDEALWHLEEPIADLSCLGLLMLSRLARESVTVALSGQGADELLGGYRKHQVAAAASALARAPRPVGATLAAAARLALPGEGTGARGLHALTTGDPVSRLLAMSRVMPAAGRVRIMSPEFLQPGAEAEIAGVIADRLEPIPLSPLGQTLLVDSRLALVDNMLLYFDKMSMAASLEVRVPFMDHDVVGFCTGLADSRRVWWGRRKELLKRASDGLVDDAIIHKRKLGFFHSAVGTWLAVHQDSLVRETLLAESTRARGQTRPEEVRRLLDSPGGRGGHKRDQIVLSLLLLERWQRLWTDAGSRGRVLASAARPPAAHPRVAVGSYEG